ncbi:MAG: hypothetical protein OQL27_03010 [Sedimenticola sp.]|nr:hypothetical protein [Sedimenticola sp.]
MSQNETGIAIDSQCLSYLIDAISGLDEPTDELADEKKALLRIWFYQPETFWVTGTVASECSKIKNIERHELHQSFISMAFMDPPQRDKSAIHKRTVTYMLAHPKANDCRILAETVDLGLNVLLSYDHRFLSRLSAAEPAVMLAKPTEYWNSLNIPLGAPLVTAPHPSNPLSERSWWLWQ